MYWESGLDKLKEIGRLQIIHPRYFIITILVRFGDSALAKQPNHCVCPHSLQSYTVQSSSVFQHGCQVSRCSLEVQVDRMLERSEFSTLSHIVVTIGFSGIICYTVIYKELLIQYWGMALRLSLWDAIPCPVLLCGKVLEMWIILGKEFMYQDLVWAYFMKIHLFFEIISTSNTWSPFLFPINKVISWHLFLIKNWLLLPSNTLIFIHET